MQGKVWFGTRAYMQWVPAPAIEVDASRQGFAATTAFLSGGLAVRRSKTSARRYEFSWNLKRRADIAPIIDYADGVYGDEYIYYLDPFASDRNILPPYWAAPYMNYYDGPVIVDGIRPTLIANSSVTNDYPLESALYSVTDDSNSPSVYVPIPPGYTAHIGVHGTLDSGSAFVSAYYGGTDHAVTLLSSSSTTRTNMTISGNSYPGFELTFKSASAGVLQIDGMIVQVLPDGAVVPSGGFISGQGTSGLTFENQPSISQYSAAMDRVGVSATLVETEAWKWQ